MGMVLLERFYALFEQNLRDRRGQMMIWQCLEVILGTAVQIENHWC